MKICWAIVTLSLLALSGRSLGDALTGKASVIDGDTLEIDGTRIRLWGIDAPESNQLCRTGDSVQYQCGAKSANELAAFIEGRPINCVPVSLDQYGQTFAVCSVNGVDLGDWLIRNGLALDWPLYSKGKYDGTQREADHAGQACRGRPRPRGARGRALAAGRSARRIAAALRCHAPRAFGREGSRQARLPQTVGKAPSPAG
jgi:endonuclease YncB( thermonuclease family)